MPTSLKDQIYDYVHEKYNTQPEFLWFRYPNYAVFRNCFNRKWYGIIMDIPYKKLGINKEGVVDILNVKVTDVLFKDFLLKQPGFLKAYHMAGKDWISILLDRTVNKGQVFELIDDSYLTISKQK